MFTTAISVVSCSDPLLALKKNLFFFPSLFLRAGRGSGDETTISVVFLRQVVKPGDSTTFDVMFLARAVGAVQNTLYIHTSLGTFDYKVGGDCG